MEVDFNTEPMSSRIVQADVLAVDIYDEDTDNEESKSEPHHEQTPWSNSQDKFSNLRHLTIVDSNIVGLAKLLDALGLTGGNLEQLIIIFNEDFEDLDGLEGSP